MKKIYLLVAMTLIMISCNSNDEENFPKDELLAGTVWKMGTLSDEDGLYPTDVTDTVEVVADTVAVDGLYPTETDTDTVVVDSVAVEPVVEIISGNLYENFPDLVYTKGEVYSKERSDTTWLSGELYGAKLTFSGNKCILYEENFEDIEITKIEQYMQTTTYVAQSLTSVLTPYYKLEVTKNAIILYKTNPYTGYQTSEIYCSLQNFQYTTSWEEELSTEYETILYSQNSETFNYQRTGNEVILTNNNKKWIGTLDTDAWTLSFVQIIPEKKEIPTFSLK